MSDVEILKLIADLPTNLSGLNVTSTVNISGQVVKISGETVRAEVSGDTIRALISGDAVALASGAYLASGIYVQTAGGGQVSGAVNISGDIRSVLSGVMDIVDRAERLLGIAKVSGETIIGKVSGETLRSLISGDTIRALISGDIVGRTWDSVIISGDIRSVLSGIIVAKVSGETVRALISGDTIRALISGDVVRVSGETIIAKVSGETVDVFVPTVLKTFFARPITAASGGEVLQSGAVKSLIVKAQGIMYMGGSGYRPYSGFGLELLSGEGIEVNANNFDAVYLFATTSGQLVTALGLL